MALNCANWTDKQLDELSDLLRSSDYSAVASFIAQNFLCIGSRIMTDPAQTTLRVTVNGTDARAVDLSAGVFLNNQLVSQVDTTQTINVLDTTIGAWGAGQAPDSSNPRWDIIEVKWNDQLNTLGTRWFVDDTGVPNTYYPQSVNTLINKAYYDIQVKHGTPSGSPVVPPTDSGYWAIAEIYVPPLPNDIITLSNIYDTADPRGSQAPTPPGPNWTSTTRVLRLEFWSTLFAVDHDPTTGYHRLGAWHIGSTEVLTTGNEINQALHGIEGTVTAQNLGLLTDGSVLTPGELHSHGSNITFLTTSVRLASWSALHSWTNFNITPYVTGVPKFAMLQVEMLVDVGGTNYGAIQAGAYFRANGSTQTFLPRILGRATVAANEWRYGSYESVILMVPVDSSAIFQAEWIITSSTGGGTINTITGNLNYILPSYVYIDLLGYSD